ncbi:MAG: hypothetical protein Hyperionvirus7_85 [Hyperionvirus sp.]|uniref:MORN repeat-containing protein n=1 Tax=Hyperionvirus sp. TaxID=2487770 RepID=A0A3G5AAF6_9VIRU|nr:MAG: hypothetical protein Hyperionvirus7_85 [Hyperionvirus sp.]
METETLVNIIMYHDSKRGETVMKSEDYWINKRTKMKDGVYTGYYKNGIISTIRTYHKNKLHGRVENYNRNGNLISMIEYHYGKYHGRKQIWEYGKIDQDYEYVDNQLHGIALDYKDGEILFSTLYVDGLMVRQLCYHWNGILKSDIEYYPNKFVKKINVLNDSAGRDCILGDGVVYGWKVCKVGATFVYVKLKVPGAAQRVTPIDQGDAFISRVEYAITEKIFDAKGKEYKEAKSYLIYNKILTYKVNSTVHPDKFDPSLDNNSSCGINMHKYKDQCDIWIRSNFHS